MELDGVRPGVASEHFDAACVGTKQSEEDSERGCLPRPVWAEESVHLSSLDREVEAIQSPDRAIALLDSTDSDDIRHPRSPCCGWWSPRRRWPRGGLARTPTG